jgi:hypothetical protein
VLEKKMVLEQAIVGSPLLLGNKVTLFQDGPPTYADMFAAIRRAQDHVNLDWHSFLDNDEINAVILGRDFAQKMQVMFAADLEVSHSFDLQTWEQRPLHLRFKEWFAQVWERLL